MADRPMKDRTNPFRLYPTAAYHEDDGVVLWWHVPVQEPPHVGYGCGEWRADGTPTFVMTGIESGWLTHWSYIPDPRKMDVAICDENGSVLAVRIYENERNV